MNARQSRAVALQIKRFLGNLVRARVLGRQNVLPQFCLAYFTYVCNANCAFCSREKEVKGKCQGERCDLFRLREILVQIRKITTNLYVTGGEPTILRDLVERLKIARELEFWPIIMNTNAILLNQHWEIMKLLDKLVVSLHTVDTIKLAQTYDVDQEVAERALANIVEAARRSKIPGHAKLMSNLVLTPTNVGDADAVLDFCLEHGIELAVVPAIVGQKPLIESAEPKTLEVYTQFLDRVIAQKRKNPRTVQGSLAYLWHIRNLKAVDCRPSAMLSISPSGNVLHPCDGHYRVTLGRLDEQTSAMSILSSKLDPNAPFRTCPHRCLKACYAQLAVLTMRPFQSVWDYLWTWFK